MDISSWNVGHVWKTVCKWSSWSLIWEQDGTSVSYISHIQVHFLSSVINIISVLFPSPSLAVLLKIPIVPVHFSIQHWPFHTFLHTCTTSNPTVYALFPNSLPISFLSFVSVLPQVVLCHDLCVRDVCCYLLYSLCLCCRLYRREWKKHRIWSGKAAVFSNKNVPNMCCTSLNKRPIMWPHICRSQTVFCKPLKWANCSWKLHFYCQIW